MSLAIGVGAPAAPAVAGRDVTRDPASPVPADGSSRCSAALQAVLDRGPGVYGLPPGSYLLDRPVFIRHDNTSIVGAGQFSTSLFCGGCFPAFVALPDPSDGYTIGAADRPDAFGKLDTTVAAVAGQAYGFRTNGRTLALGVGNASQLGIAQAGNTWDHWGSLTGLTINLAFDCNGTALPAQTQLAGFGTANGPRPWSVDIDAGQPDHARLCCTLEDGTLLIHTAPLTQNTAGVNRLKWWLDFTAGTVGAWVDGAAVTVQQITGGVFTGKRLRAHRRDNPFQLAGAANTADLGHALADVSYFGLRVVGAAVSADEGTDGARYLDTTGNTIWCLWTDREPGRLLRVRAGAKGGSDGRLILVDAPRYGNFLANVRITDLEIRNGGVTIGGVYGTTLDRVTAGGAVALNSLPTIANYPVVARNCNFGGGDAAVSLWNAIAVFDVCNIGGGQTGIRLNGAGVTATGCMWNTFSSTQESALDSWNDSGYNADTRLVNCVIDNEGQTLRYGFRVENPPDNSGTFFVRGGAMNLASVTPFLLTGYPVGPVYGKTFVDISGFRFTAGPAAALTIAGATGAFTGNADLRIASTGAVTGSGYNPPDWVIKA